MKIRRDIFLYAGLLVTAIGFAYYTSLPVDKSAGDKTEWLKIEPASVSKLSYSDSNITVDIEKRDGQLYWVKYTDLKESPNGEVYEFRANKQFQDVLATFNPMYIVRDLGEAKDVDLAKFDLSNSVKSLSIEAAGQTRGFKLGKRSYGSREMYLLDEKAGHVVMMAGSAFDKIKNARSSLYERKLFDLVEKDIKKALLSSNGVELEMDHSNKNSKGAPIWSDPKDPEIEKPSYKSLVSKVEKLSAQAYASNAERDGLTKLKSFAEFTFFDDSNRSFVVKFYKQQKKPESTYWVWSSFLDSFVKIDSTRGEGVEKDVPNFLN